MAFFILHNFFSNLFRIITLTFVIANAHAQNLDRYDQKDFPKVITEAYLDSTRNLTKGDNKLNATYLSLAYNFKNVDSVEWMYTEIRVPKGEAPLRTYYCAIQGYGYYCGLQTNSENERRIIFSVWDSKEKINSTNKVADTEKAVLISAGENVAYSSFGNEGSGVHTHLKFNWYEDSTYKFLIHSVPDPVLRNTTIALFVERENTWELIAKIKRSEYIGYEKGAAAFLEDFSGRDDKHRRSVSFQNFWVKKESGEWKEINRAYYYLPNGDSNRKVKDYGCSRSTSFGFMLTSGGGFTGAYLQPPLWMTRDPSGITPVKKMPE